MIHTISKRRVVVEGTKEGLLCIRLCDYGDADHLEDRLIEDFNISPIWRREEEAIEGGTVFVLILPEAPSRAGLQATLDQIE